MINGINVEAVKQYNASVRAHKERASKIRAEIDFNKAELNRLCTDLSNELGLEVTAENIEMIYNERVAKINSTLATGMEILKRVEEEEAAANRPQQAQVQQPVQSPVFETGVGFTGDMKLPEFMDANSTDIQI